MRPLPSLILLLAASLIVLGCGSASTPPARNVDTPDQPAPATATTPRATVDRCTPPLRIFPATSPLAAGDVDAATRELARAVTRAGASRRPFVTDGDVVVDDGLRARARLVGTRAANGSSSGHLDWRGAAGLLLPDGDLRIAGNQLALRRDDQRAAGFTPLGSASGIALDVGRELLTHPFLLDVVATGGSGSIRSFRLVARPDELRAYAGTERQGLATELLLGARSLTIDARVVDGTLVADTFRLVTTLPPRFEALAGGGTVTVVGRTIAGCTPA